jgi:hypothetical protein
VPEGGHHLRWAVTPAEGAAELLRKAELVDLRETALAAYNAHPHLPHRQG